MTPLQILIMIHYHTRVGPYAEHDPEHATSPAVNTQRQSLIADGLLEYSDADATWRSTEKGKAYVAHLCAVQVPIAQWVQP